MPLVAKRRRENSDWSNSVNKWVEVIGRRGDDVQAFLNFDRLTSLLDDIGL